MALYLGSSNKQQIILGNVIYNINWFSAMPTIEDIILASSDDCLLKDYNGLYLIPKEEN